MTEAHKDKKGKKYVIASELHAKLGIKSPLRKWFDRMLKYDFVENHDYYQMDKKVHLSKTGQTRNEWHLTLDMAKEIAMVQRTPEGKDQLVSLDKF